MGVLLDAISLKFGIWYKQTHTPTTSRSVKQGHVAIARKRWPLSISRLKRCSLVNKALLIRRLQVREPKKWSTASLTSPIPAGRSTLLQFKAWRLVNHNTKTHSKLWPAQNHQHTCTRHCTVMYQHSISTGTEVNHPSYPATPPSAIRDSRQPLVK